jgi:pSer/pThr/pTyr-binding forkhead associated (FHA) protein
MVVRLKVMHGPSAGKEIKISKAPFVIGRQDDCHLRPKSDAISRRHCELVFGESQVIIRDLGSKNGTYVNGDRVAGDRVLKLGDHLKVGPLEFEVQFDVGLSSEKRPKVAGVKDAALRSSDSSFGDADVSSWLDEPAVAGRARPPIESETRQFKLEETDRLALAAGGKAAAGKSEAAGKGESAVKSDVASTDAKSEAKSEVTPGADADASKSESSSTTLTVEELKKKLESKEVGKLAPRQEATTANSREAAADALKKFFNRR